MLLLSWSHNKVYEHLYWPDFTTFQGLGVQIKISLNSMIMDIFDTWYYETMIFIAGLYGTKAQAA